MPRPIPLLAISHYAPLSDQTQRYRLILTAFVGAFFVGVTGFSCATTNGAAPGAFAVAALVAWIAFVLLAYDYRRLVPEEARQFGDICDSHPDLGTLMATLSLPGYTPRWRDWEAVRRYAQEPAHSRDESRRKRAVDGIRATLQLRKRLAR